jgi:amidase
VLGPLARTVHDAAAFLDAVAIPQPGVPDPAPPLADGDSFLRWCDRDPGRLRIGRYCESSIESELDLQVRSAWERASDLLANLGHDIEDVPAPVPRGSVPAFETVWAVSAATIPVSGPKLAELRPLTRHLRERGLAITAADYAIAQGQLNVFARRGMAATDHLDAVLTPTLAMLPRPVGWFTDGGDPAADFERQKRFTPFAALYNVTGQPAISLPLFHSEEGLPIGVMLVGRQRGDAALLGLAAQIERAAPWRNRHPDIWNVTPAAK